MSTLTETHSDDSADITQVVASVMRQAGPQLTDGAPGPLAECRRQLAGLGLWTLGTAERVGGGGAQASLVAATLMEMAATSAALAWACAQTHAAVGLLGDGQPHADLRSQLHAGATGVAVVSQPSAPRRIGDSDGDGLVGPIPRIDAAAEAPWIIVLTAAGPAVLLAPGDVRPTPLRRTGFDGALTCSAEFAEGASAQPLDGGDTDAARCLLWNAGVAIAAGIATAAVQAASSYCAQRHQFGGPLTSIGAVRDELFGARELAADLRRAAMAPSSVVADAAGAFDLACDQALDAAALAVQVHGGYGYLTEYRVERLLRDVISLRAAGDAAGARQAGAQAWLGAT
jgi:alkylation response protein AidB-like acyl-CoA dehydrogenase